MCPLTVRIRATDAGLLHELASNSGADEACALLVGTGTEILMTVESLLPSPNVSGGDRAQTFEIDPILHLQAQKKARSDGERVLGVWHSHPHGAPFPSETDRRRSLEAGFVWLISAPSMEGGGTWCMQAFVAAHDDPHRLVPARLEFEA